MAFGMNHAQYTLVTINACHTCGKSIRASIIHDHPTVLVPALPVVYDLKFRISGTLQQYSCLPRPVRLQLAAFLEEEKVAEAGSTPPAFSTPECDALIISLRCAHTRFRVDPGYGRDPTPWIHCQDCLLHQPGSHW